MFKLQREMIFSGKFVLFVFFFQVTCKDQTITLASVCCLYLTWAYLWPTTACIWAFSLFHLIVQRPTFIYNPVDM